MKKPGKPQTGGKGKKKKQVVKYVLDCTHPVEDGIMDVASFVGILMLTFCWNVINIFSG